MLQGIVITMMQCWESTFLFDAFMTRKENRRSFVLRLLLSGFVFGLSYNLLFPAPSVISCIFSALFFLLINELLYSDHFYNRILIVLGWYALLVSVDGTITPLFAFLLKPEPDLFSMTGLIYLIAFCELAVIFLLSVLFSCISHPSHKSGTDHKWYAFTSGLYILSIAIFLIFALLILYDTAIPAPLVSSCISFVVVCSILLQKREQHMAQLQKESLSLNEQLTAESESIEILSDAYSRQRKLTHDYNSHLLTLNALLQQKEFGRMESYLNELMHTQTERILSVNTHHAVLDAIFNQKAIIAQKNHIDLQFHFNDLRAVAISSCDLAVILGNLMDNAIEAAVKLPVQDRLIEVSAVLDENFMVSIRNRSLPVTILNGRIRTTKAHPELHGFGLANIDSILSHYPDPFHSMEYADGWFCYTFEMPNSSRTVQ